MPKLKKYHFDALVIGGGIIGMLTARNLNSAGLQVALIEKDTLGSQASWAAGGILSALHPWQGNPSIQSLIDEGRNSFADLSFELEQETGINPEYVQSGMLVLDCEEYEQAKIWATKNNLRIEHLEHSVLQKLEPALAEKYHQALYIPDLAQIRPPNLIRSIRKSLLLREIEVFEHTEVNKLIIEKRSVTGVKTTNDELYAKHVFVSTGAWSKQLLTSEVDIEPVRGQILLYKPDKNLISHILLKDKTYLIPRLDGHILCGSTLEHTGFNNQITQQARHDLQAFAQDLVPQLADQIPIKQWSGLRPGTKRDAPYIQKHPDIDGLYLNCGHYRYGIVMSAASARWASEMITRIQNASQTTAFA